MFRPFMLNTHLYLYLIARIWFEVRQFAAEGLKVDPFIPDMVLQVKEFYLYVF